LRGECERVSVWVDCDDYRLKMVKPKIILSLSLSWRAFYQQNQENCPSSETVDWRVDRSLSQLKSLELHYDFLNHSLERNNGGLGQGNISIWQMERMCSEAKTSTKIEGVENWRQK